MAQVWLDKNPPSQEKEEGELDEPNDATEQRGAGNRPVGDDQRVRRRIVFDLFEGPHTEAEQGRRSGWLNDRNIQGTPTPSNYSFHNDDRSEGRHQYPEPVPRRQQRPDRSSIESSRTSLIPSLRPSRDTPRGLLVFPWIHGWNTGTEINILDPDYGEWLRRRVNLWSGRYLDRHLNYGLGMSLQREYGQSQLADINGQEYAAFITQQILLWNDANPQNPIRKG